MAEGYRQIEEADLQCSRYSECNSYMAYEQEMYARGSCSKVNSEVVGRSSKGLEIQKYYYHSISI